MTGEELLASVARHFDAGCAALSTSQMREHQVTGSCEECRHATAIAGIRLTGGHAHGDPSLECTIPGCRYPDSRFLCGLLDAHWHAGKTLGICVLPPEHRGRTFCEDQHGYIFRSGPRGAPLTDQITTAIATAVESSPGS
jgi:hypothetical protein